MLDEQCVTGQAGVIGAGTMGSGIAAQLANAGWTVHLLDVAGEAGAERNKAARAGLDRVVTARPPLLYLPEFASRIVPGNTTDDMGRLADCQWVVEAVAERMDVKQSVMAAIEMAAGPETVVTSNTSGLGLAEMVEACSPDFRRRFLGTHFLNPPRYLKLLELVPLADTGPALADGFFRFAEQVLGQRAVHAKDTPGFISTRIWIEHLLETIRLTEEFGLSVEEVDYLTGAFLGRPRSGTFRMADLVGLDIVAAIAGNQYARLMSDPFREKHLLPACVQSLLEAGRLGDKSGGGFYRREGRETLALDIASGEYRPRREVRLDDAEALLTAPLPDRVAAIAKAHDAPWSRFLYALLSSLFEYVQYGTPIVADSEQDVDEVMRLGFHWQMGPWAMQQAFEGKQSVQIAGSSALPVPSELDSLPIILDSPSGVLVDLGDGVACVGFRTRLGTFDPELTAFLNEARERAERDFRALVIAGGGTSFSAGYNLKFFLAAREQSNWDGIDAALTDVQQTVLALRCSKIPIVAAPHGYALGGGCECVLRCSAVQANAELTIGMPEFTLGLLPAGSGITALLTQLMAGVPPNADPYPELERLLDRLIKPENSTNAYQAIRMGLIPESSGISRDPRRQLTDARALAIALANGQRAAIVENPIRVLGQGGLARLRMRLNDAYRGGKLTEFERFAADRYAWALCGGDLPGEPVVSERYLLRLEREAFLELIKRPEAEARVRAVLATGKPIRN